MKKKIKKENCHLGLISRHFTFSCLKLKNKKNFFLLFT